jgi:hypothetical protein
MLSIVFLLASCSDTGVGPAGRRFNVLLQYGIGARNEIDSFHDAFTKDLVLDGTVTTKLVLSEAQLDSIEARLLSIDIFSYPDTFVSQHGDTVASVTPYSTYILKVTLDGRSKNVFWEDAIISPDERAARLRDAFAVIRTLIESTAEFKRLPPARGGYD